MTTHEAHEILGLRPGAGPDERLAAYQKQRELLEVKLGRSPTPGLKTKYRGALERLDEAYEVLELADDPGDLPSLRQPTPDLAAEPKTVAGAESAHRDESVDTLEQLACEAADAGKWEVLEHLLEGLERVSPGNRMVGQLRARMAAVECRVKKRSFLKVGRQALAKTVEMKEERPAVAIARDVGEIEMEGAKNAGGPEQLEDGTDGRRGGRGGTRAGGKQELKRRMLVGMMVGMVAFALGAGAWWRKAQQRDGDRMEVAVPVGDGTTMATGQENHKPITQPTGPEAITTMPRKFLGKPVSWPGLENLDLASVIADKSHPAGSAYWCIAGQRIYKLRDSDGDGRADVSTMFAFFGSFPGDRQTFRLEKLETSVTSIRLSSQGKILADFIDTDGDMESDKVVRY